MEKRIAGALLHRRGVSGPRSLHLGQRHQSPIYWDNCARLGPRLKAIRWKTG